MINKIINYVKIKLKMEKFEIGKSYKVIKTPNGKVSSGGVGQSDINCSTYVVEVTSKKCGNQYNVRTIKENNISVCSRDNGWLFDYEMAPLVMNLETIKEEIIELKSYIEDRNLDVKVLEDKLSFMELIGVESFEEEFKAYQVLKVLGIDDFEKAKQITKILSK